MLGEDDVGGKPMNMDEFEALPLEAKLAIRSSLSELGKAACDYAEMGWAVFPLCPRSKTPAFAGGHNEACDDWESVCYFWSRNPDYNVGIATGAASGNLLVIDVDQDEDNGKYGADNLFDWEQANGKLPETVCASTGRGGVHYYFKSSIPLTSRSNQLLCIDRKAEGGYVVAPPSVHPNGEVYEWDLHPADYDVARADKTVYDLIVYCDAGNGTGTDSSDGGKFQFPDVVHDGEGREHYLSTYAFSLRTQGMDYESIYAELSRINMERVVPPKHDSDIRRMAKSACKKPAGLSPEYQAAKDRAERRKADEAERAAREYESLIESEKSSKGVVDPMVEQRIASLVTNSAPPIMRLSDMVGKDLPPLRPEIIEGVLRENCKMLVQGASKAGKTWLMIELAVAMALGRRWLGWKCRKGRVLYVNFELQPESFLSRLEKVCRGMGAPLDEAMRGIDLWNLRGFSASMEEMNDRHFFPTISRGEYQIIILDPFYKLMEGSENDAEVVGMFVRHLERLCVAKDVAVVYVHHYSKGLKGDVSPMDRASGSGVFARDADTLIDLAELQMNEGFEVPPEHEGEHCFRVSPVMRDFKPQDPFDVWFTMGLVHELDSFGDCASLEVGTTAQKGGKASGATRRKQSMSRSEEVCESVVSVLVSSDSAVNAREVQQVTGIKDFKTFKKYLANDDRIATFRDRSRGGALMVDLSSRRPKMLD